MKIADHSRTVSRRFSLKAASYGRHAGIQRTMAEQLIALVPPEQPRTPVLDVGCGTGQLTRHIIRRWPGATVHAIDIAPGMIRHAEQHFPSEGSVHWIIANAMTYRSETPYDLILSNCALHWLHPFLDGVRNIASLLSPQGHFAAAIMLDGTLSELRESRLRAAPLKPPAGRLPTFDEALDVFRENGLNINYASEDHRRVLAPRAEDVLRMVREQGLSGGHVSRSHQPLTRGELAELARDYNFNFRTAEGLVQVSYNVGLFVARRSG